MKTSRMVLALCLAGLMAGFAAPVHADPMCGQIRRCFALNSCLDRLIEAELADIAIDWYDENCVDRGIEV
jgi:hypothetical protein